MSNVIVDRVARKHRYPMASSLWLRNLTWDGHRRIHRWLTTYLAARSDEGGEEWFAMAVRRALEVAPMEVLFVLYGPQAIGKTAVVEALRPPSGYYQVLIEKHGDVPVRILEQIKHGMAFANAGPVYILTQQVAPPAFRRVLAVEVGALGRVDLDGLRADRDQLWAEATHRYSVARGLPLDSVTKESRDAQA
jgi:predicted P-loop ATPase